MNDNTADASPRTLAVNCSILMKDLPIPERLRRAKAAGAEAVEFWWPFASATPDAEEVEQFAAAIEHSGLQLIGLNLFAGDMAGGDRGVLSWPGREKELVASARIAVALGERLGTRRFNALYGNRIDGADPAAQDELALDSLRRIALLFDRIGAVVMIEAVSGAPRYPILTAEHAGDVVNAASAGDGPDNVGILIDLYHLAANGDDVETAIARYGADAAHVQIADAPGRGAPGTGDLRLREWVGTLRAAGYDGWVALEYADPDDDPLNRFDLTKWKDLA